MQDLLNVIRSVCGEEESFALAHTFVWKRMWQSRTFPLSAVLTRAEQTGQSRKPSSHAKCNTNAPPWKPTDGTDTNMLTQSVSLKHTNISLFCRSKHTWTRWWFWLILHWYWTEMNQHWTDLSLIIIMFSELLYCRAAFKQYVLTAIEIMVTWLEKKHTHIYACIKFILIRIE